MNKTQFRKDQESRGCHLLSTTRTKAIKWVSVGSSKLKLTLFADLGRWGNMSFENSKVDGAKIHLVKLDA